MRPESLPGVSRRAAALGIALIGTLAFGGIAHANQASSGASGIPADTTLLVRVAPPDTSRIATGAAPDSTQDLPASSVNFEEQRKRGDVSLEQAFRGRRGALLMPLPVFGSANGSLTMPDGGSRIRSSPLGMVADVATDATLFSAESYGVGIFDLAVALDNPRADAVETLDLTSIRRGLEPGPFRRAGELIAQPAADRALTRVMPGEGGRQRRTRSALYYGYGEGGVLDTGARLITPNLLRGLGGSYARHEADGVSPLRRGISSRYALAAGLPRLLDHSLWIEGSLFQWDVEDEATQPDPVTFAPTTVLARAEISSRDLTLHGRAGGERWESGWTLRSGNAKRTRVEADGARERWEFPGWAFAWNGTLEPADGWTAIASLHAASRRIEYRVDASPLFDPRRDEARVGAGLRRNFGTSGGVELDLAADWRETSSTLPEGRLSVWRQSKRAAGRIDVEWAHERPSWVDLLSPERVIVAARLPDASKWLRLERRGDPTLDPRRLAGALARGTYEVSSRISIEAEGSVRRIGDDFGWNLSILDTADTIFVETRAAMRGDGWSSYGALGFVLRPGPFRLRGSAWARGGLAGLSPQAGVPPRVGGDAALEFGVTLFRGDLPLGAGIDFHLQGRREGIVNEPGWGTVDLSLRADFGSAGAFAQYDNVFDHRAPSALYDIEAGQPVSLPERSFHFGLVWYLLD